MEDNWLFATLFANKIVAIKEMVLDREITLLYKIEPIIITFVKDYHLNCEKMRPYLIVIVLYVELGYFQPLVTVFVNVLQLHKGVNDFPAKKRIQK